jgi:hypothetical protein
MNKIDRVRRAGLLPELEEKRKNFDWSKVPEEIQ